MYSISTSILRKDNIDGTFEIYDVKKENRLATSTKVDCGILAYGKY